MNFFKTTRLSLVLLALFVSSIAQAQLIPVPVSGPTSRVNCAILNGALICSGDNVDGQLGDGTILSSYLPIVIIPSGVTAAAFGTSHSCAVVKGALKCWGSNSSGQLGTGLGTGSNLLPKTIIASGVTAVAAGDAHTCALMNVGTTTGTLKCWGDDTSGQIGDGTTNSSTVWTPKQIVASGVSKISSGKNHMCSLTGTALKCWGDNTYGQIAKGDEGDDGETDVDDVEDTTPIYPAPAAVATGVTMVKLGANHSCGIQAGVFFCAGANDEGQLGLGHTTPTSVPKPIIELGVTDFSLGEEHTCAIRYGALKCWGLNAVGQLGIDTGVIGTNTAVPLTVVGLGVTAISTGPDRTCIVWDKTQYCSGANDVGQLGNGDITDRDEFTESLIK